MIPDYDRTETNTSDGMTFYGFDNEEDGTTTWYSEDGSLDSITSTPCED